MANAPTFNILNMKPQDYVEENIVSLIEIYLPVFMRNIKNNNHYKDFTKALQASCDIQLKYHGSYYTFLIHNIASIIHRSQTSTYKYTAWSIHNTRPWGNGWEDEYTYDAIDITAPSSHKILIVMAFGMLLNVLGHDCYSYGYFYDDYQLFKNNILHSTK